MGPRRETRVYCPQQTCHSSIIVIKARSVPPNLGLTHNKCTMRHSMHGPYPVWTGPPRPATKSHQEWFSSSSSVSPTSLITLVYFISPNLNALRRLSSILRAPSLRVRHVPRPAKLQSKTNAVQSCSARSRSQKPQGRFCIKGRSIIQRFRPGHSFLSF